MAHNMSDVELQTYEALYKNQGARIMFHCDQVTYQGIIDSVVLETHLAKLRHVKILEGGEYFRQLRFHFKDLASFKIVESAESVNKYPKNEYLMNILKNNQPVKPDVILKTLYKDQLPDESEDEAPEENTEEDNFVLDLPKHLEHKLPTACAVIDTIDDDFFQAVQSIIKRQLVGVSFHGPAISRFNKLTWICISTEVYLFVFDIQKLEKKAFDEGLREIFESQYVKKIIHDCRFPSDCLAHQYNTHLTNVFDTRVADYIVHKQRYHGKYEFHPFTSLDGCLRTYLEVPQDFLFKRDTSQSSSSKECASSKRPISNDCLYDLLKSVVYLIVLQEKLYKEMLASLYRATNIYRTVLTRSDQQLIELLGYDLSRPDTMIPAILMYGIQTARFEEAEEHKKVTVGCSFVIPHSGEVIQSKLGSPKTVSNDSVPRDKCKEVSTLPNKEKIENEAPSCLTDLKDDKVAAVKKAVLQYLEKRKKVMAEKMNNCEATKKPVMAEKMNNCEATEKTVMAEKANNCEATSSSDKSGYVHINKIYYPTSISEMYPGQLGNIQNLKPVDYVSKFSDKLPLSSCFDADSDASGEDADKYFDLSSMNSSLSIKESEESGDIWSKLRAEFLAERENSPAYCNEKKVSFVPG